MTAAELRRVTGGAEPYRTHGWLASLLCHLAGMGCAMMLMAKIEKPAFPTPFHWDVAMVEAPAPVEPTPVDPSPTPPESRPAKRVESQPPVEPVVPVQQIVREVVPTVETLESVQRVVHEIAPSVEMLELVQQSVPEMGALADRPLERPAVHSAEAHPVVARVVTTSPEAVIEQVASQAAVASLAEMRDLIDAAPQVSRSDVVKYEASAVEPASSAVEHRVVQQRRVQYRQAQADYGWLRDALWGRIQELKRYPPQAQANHWEGKVVVEAIVRDNGEVVGLKVAESSGRAVLDEAAMAVMKKASPLTLKHPLGRSQVTILVPISYRLDG